MENFACIYTTKQNITRTYIYVAHQQSVALTCSRSVAFDIPVLPLTRNCVLAESKATFMQQQPDLRGKTVATNKTGIENPDCTLQRICI
jgi:hypothetical protein